MLVFISGCTKQDASIDKLAELCSNNHDKDSLAIYGNTIHELITDSVNISHTIDSLVHWRSTITDVASIQLYGVLVTAALEQQLLNHNELLFYRSRISYIQANSKCL